MAKPRQPDNRPDTPEGPGEGGKRAGDAMVEAGREGRNRGTRPQTPPPGRRRDQTQERHNPTGSGAWKYVKEDAGEQEEGDRQVYIPRGVTVEVICMGGGGCPPGGKRGPPGLYLGPYVPVIAGSLRRLSTSQRWVAPGWGSQEQRHMAELLAPASRIIG